MLVDGVISLFCQSVVQLVLTFDNMKRLGFRAEFLSIEEKVGARTKPSQTTEHQLFYIVCYRALLFIF